MLPSDMNLRIGETGFKIGTNLKTNLDVKSKEVEMVKTEPDVKSKVKTKPDVKQKKEPDIKSNKEHKQDVKPNIESNKERKHDVKMIRTKPDMNMITYEEEKVALRLGTTAVFTVWWMFKGPMLSLSLS